MTQLVLQVPESVFASLHRAPDEFGQELRVAAGVKWYELGKVSPGLLNCEKGRLFSPPAGMRLDTRPYLRTAGCLPNPGDSGARWGGTKTAWPAMWPTRSPSS